MTLAREKKRQHNIEIRKRSIPGKSNQILVPPSWFKNNIKIINKTSENCNRLCFANNGPFSIFR